MLNCCNALTDENDKTVVAAGLAAYAGFYFLQPFALYIAGGKTLR
jgi:hypothetical protein